MNENNPSNHTKLNDDNYFILFTKSSVETKDPQNSELNENRSQINSNLEMPGSGNSLYSADEKSSFMLTNGDSPSLNYDGSDLNLGVMELENGLGGKLSAGTSDPVRGVKDKDLEQENQCLRNEFEKLLSERNQLKRSLKERDCFVRDLKENLTRCCDKQQALIRENDLLSQTKQEMYICIKHLKQKLDRARSQNYSKEKSESDDQRDGKVTMERKLELECRLESVTNIVEQQNKEIRTLKSMLTESCQENEELRNEMAKITQKDTPNWKLKEKDYEIKKLLRDKESLKDENDILKEKLRTFCNHSNHQQGNTKKIFQCLQDKLSKKMEDLQIAKMKQRQMEEELLQCRKEVDSHRQTINDLRNQYEDKDNWMKSEINKMQTSSLGMEKSATDWKEKCEALQSELTKSKEQLSRYQETISCLRSELDEEKTRSSALKKDIKDIMHDRGRAENEAISRCDAQSVKLKAQGEELRELKKSYCQACKDIEWQKMELVNRTNELKCQLDENEHLKLQVQGLCKEMKEQHMACNQKVVHLEKVIADSDFIIGKKDAQINKLCHEVSRYRKQGQQLGDYGGRDPGMETDSSNGQGLEDVKHENDCLKNSINELQSSVGWLKEEQSKMRNINQSLEQQMTELQESFVKLEKDRMMMKTILMEERQQRLSRCENHQRIDQLLSIIGQDFQKLSQVFSSCGEISSMNEGEKPTNTFSKTRKKASMPNSSTGEFTKTFPPRLCETEDKSTQKKSDNGRFSKKYRK